VNSCVNSPEDGPVGPKHVEIRRYMNKIEIVTSAGSLFHMFHLCLCCTILISLLVLCCMCSYDMLDVSRGIFIVSSTV